MISTPEKMTSTPEEKPRKLPYRAPSLHHYGDLSRITNMVGKNGLPDGGRGNTKGTMS